MKKIHYDDEYHEPNKVKIRNHKVKKMKNDDLSKTLNKKQKSKNKKQKLIYYIDNDTID